MSGDQEHVLPDAEQPSYQDGDENYQEGGDSLPNYKSSREMVKRNRKGPRSLLWRKFTIVDNQKCVASCDICGTHMNYRSTISNLKNHLIRKHKYDIKTNTCIKSESNITVGHKPRTRVRSGEHAFKPRVSQVGGIDDLVFKVVVGEEDEDQQATVSILPDQIIEEPIQVEDHSDYTYTLETAQEDHSVQTDTPQQHQGTQRIFQSVRPIHRKIDYNERNKRQKILDLQLECLEMKKYSMQIETLMMEQQMNLPRSIFTETLRGSHTYTRGTQTDIGGNKTKVLYLSNKSGEAVHHFISLQDPDD